eukprot:3933231-Rhodomonas_salina.1
MLPRTSISTIERRVLQPAKGQVVGDCTVCSCASGASGFGACSVSGPGCIMVLVRRSVPTCYVPSGPLCTKGAMSCLSQVGLVLAVGAYRSLDKGCLSALLDVHKHMYRQKVRLAPVCHAFRSSAD